MDDNPIIVGHEAGKILKENGYNVKSFTGLPTTSLPPGVNLMATSMPMDDTDKAEYRTYAPQQHFEHFDNIDMLSSDTIQPVRAKKPKKPVFKYGVYKIIRFISTLPVVKHFFQ